MIKSIALSLMFVSLGVQVNWTEDLGTGPSQFRGGVSLPVIVGSAPDAVGDAFGNALNLDVSSWSANLVGGNVSISMDFVTPYLLLMQAIQTVWSV